MCVLVLYLVHIKLIPIRVRLHRVSMLASMCVFCSALSISKQVLGATLTVVLGVILNPLALNISSVILQAALSFDVA